MAGNDCDGDDCDGDDCGVMTVMCMHYSLDTIDSARNTKPSSPSFFPPGIGHCAQIMSCFVLCSAQGTRKGATFWCVLIIA